MKKKILFLSAVLTLGFAAVSFAGVVLTTPASLADCTGGVWTGQFGGEIQIGPNTANIKIKPSANVGMAYNRTVVGVPVAYSIGTAHTSGTFLYATSSTDTNIYRSGVLTINIPAAPASATSGVAWTTDGWSASK